VRQWSGWSKEHQAEFVSRIPNDLAVATNFYVLRHVQIDSGRQLGMGRAGHTSAALREISDAPLYQRRVGVDAEPAWIVNATTWVFSPLV